MRNAIRILVLALIAAGAYAYYQMPSGNDKELDAALAEVSSLTSNNTPQANADSPAPPPVSSPAPPPIKPWAPPDVLPAQPNWTWTTLDGTTYNNVVVTKIGPDTVSFTHAMGVAHDVPISNLPSDIQKKLNYDPVAAVAAHKEAKREEAHPFYKFADRAEAQNLARQMHWPVAWMDTRLPELSTANPVPDSEDDMSQRAINHLKSHTIIIVADGNNDLGSLPPIVLAQFFVLDDGPMPGGHHFYGPKIVFSDPDVTKTFGRISHTQIKTNGDAAFVEGLAAIPTDWAGSPSVTPPPFTPPAKTASAPPAPTSPATASSSASTPAVSPPPTANSALPWAPPDPIPAQPNWTWTTMDGTTYQNVVITKIEPDTVSITHSLGVAHIPINLLPRDLQKRLNYTKP
jgi:hypothetical protein